MSDQNGEILDRRERRLIVRGMAYAATIAERSRLINDDLMEADTAAAAMKAVIVGAIRAESRGIHDTPMPAPELMVPTDRAFRDSYESELASQSAPGECDVSD